MCLEDGTFIMGGGTISGNTANGGGVLIGHTFRKTSGTIYGADAADDDSLKKPSGRNDDSTDDSPDFS